MWMQFETKLLRGFLVMGISCNGICNRYKATKPENTGRYIAGQKRCNSCAIFLNWNGMWCPCCNYKLRLGPRSSKYKEKFLKAKSVKKEILNGL